MKNSKIDLRPNSRVLGALKYGYQRRDLDRLIESSAPNADAKTRMMIKMEINRLSQKCVRLIDLRSLFKGRCREVELGGRIHFMDSVTQEALNVEMIKYKGVYTVGVYEAIQEFAKKRSLSRDMQFSDPLEIDFLPAKMTFYRKEDRLFSSKDIEITINNKIYLAKTTNISSKGLCVRIDRAGALLQSRSALVGVSYSVFMKGFQTEFKFATKPILEYTVKSTKTNGDKLYLMMSMSSSEVGSDFARFLNRYIGANKRKNSVSTDGTKKSVLLKMNEQFILPKMKSLPILLKNSELGHVPLSMMSNGYNLNFIDVNKKHYLDDFLWSFLRSSGIQSLVSGVDPSVEIYMISPLDKNISKVYALPLSLIRENDDLKARVDWFIGKGLVKIYQCSCFPVNPSKDAYSPTSLPDSISSRFRDLNKPPSPETMRYFDGVDRLIYLENIIDQLPLFEYFLKDRSSHNENLSSINYSDLLMREIKHKKKIHEIDLEKREFRSEDRFELNMTLPVKFGETVFKGITRNISISGFQIESPDFRDIGVGAVVEIKTPDHNKKSSDWGDYRVVGKTGKDVVRLMAIGDVTDNDACDHMRKFIEANITRIHSLGRVSSLSGLSGCFRNVILNNMLGMYALSCYEGSQLSVRDVVTCKGDSEGIESKDLSSILQSNIFRTHLHEKIRSLSKVISCGSFYMAINKLTYGVFTHYSSSLFTSSESLANSKNFDNASTVIKIDVLRPEPIFNDYFYDELSYLKHYSRNKSDHLIRICKNTSSIIGIKIIKNIMQSN